MGLDSSCEMSGLISILSIYGCVPVLVNRQHVFLVRTDNGWITSERQKYMNENFGFAHGMRTGLLWRGICSGQVLPKMRKALGSKGHSRPKPIEQIKIRRDDVEDQFDLFLENLEYALENSQGSKRVFKKQQPQNQSLYMQDSSGE